MGGKSRKTGGISKKLIERIKNGGKLNKKEKSTKKINDPFGLTNVSGTDKKT